MKPFGKYVIHSGYKAFLKRLFQENLKKIFGSSENLNHQYSIVTHLLQDTFRHILPEVLRSVFVPFSQGHPFSGNRVVSFFVGLLMRAPGLPVCVNGFRKFMQLAPRCRTNNQPSPKRPFTRATINTRPSPSYIEQPYNASSGSTAAAAPAYNPCRPCT